MPETNSVVPRLRDIWLSFELSMQEKDLGDFASPVDYYRYLRRQSYTTLERKQVKSVAERYIANFLFLNGVNYAYEARATWADQSDRYRTYQPDFFLPDYGIWIEHWAVDRQGKVPDWFPIVPSGDPSVRYREGMEWKRAQFKKHGKKLIELTDYQWYEGTLISDLIRQLEENPVKFREIPMKEILDRIQSLMARINPLNELMLSFYQQGQDKRSEPHRHSDQTATEELEPQAESLCDNDDEGLAGIRVQTQGE